MARSKTSGVWMHQHVNDPFVQKAKAAGWRSRAVFKLMEIDARDHLFKPGMLVVDLGSTPGSWSQVASQRIGDKGRVIATDLLEMDPISGVTFLHGDFTSDEMLLRLEKELGQHGKVDLVLSDMAPNLSGIAVSDQARAIGLVEIALEFALDWLKPSGVFLVKVFHGAGFDAFLKTMRENFHEVTVRKPEASRDRSSEVYLLAKKPRCAA